MTFSLKYLNLERSTVAQRSTNDIVVFMQDVMGSTPQAVNKFEALLSDFLLLFLRPRQIFYYLQYLCNEKIVFNFSTFCSTRVR